MNGDETAALRTQPDDMSRRSSLRIVRSVDAMEVELGGQWQLLVTRATTHRELSSR